MWNCKTCGVEGEQNFYKSQKWYCKACWNKRTIQAGKDKLTLLREERGGKCERCGYDKCLGALEFHHLNPTVKEFHLGTRRGVNIDMLREELAKCQMLCANCHREVHSGD